MAVARGVPLTPVEKQFLLELVSNGVEFMVVRMSAADLQGANIGTQDVDLWFRRTSDSGLDRAARSVGCLFLWRADPPVLEGEELERFDVVNRCDGLGDFESEYEGAVDSDIEGIPVKLLPLARVIVSKRAANRPKDRVALPALRAALAASKIVESRRG